MQPRAKSNGNLLNKVIFLLKNNPFAVSKILDLSTRILHNLGTDKLQGKNHNDFLMTPQLDYI